MAETILAIRKRAGIVLGAVLIGGIALLLACTGPAPEDAAEPRPIAAAEELGERGYWRFEESRSVFTVRFPKRPDGTWVGTDWRAGVAACPEDGECCTNVGYAFKLWEEPRPEGQKLAEVWFDLAPEFGVISWEVFARHEEAERWARAVAESLQGTGGGCFE